MALYQRAARKVQIFLSLYNKEGNWAAIWCFHTSRKKRKKKKKIGAEGAVGAHGGAAPQAPGGGAGGAEGAPEARATTTRLLKLAYGHGYMYLLSLVGSDSLTVNVPDSARLVRRRVLQLRERSRFGLLGRLRGRHGRVPSASAKATSPRQAARNRRRNAKFSRATALRAARDGRALALRSRRWRPARGLKWADEGVPLGVDPRVPAQDYSRDPYWGAGRTGRRTGGRGGQFKPESQW